MKKFSVCFGILSAVLLVCLIALPASGKDKVTLPEAAANAVKAEFPKAEIKDVGYETESGIKVYEVELKDGDKTMSILITGEGLIISLETVIALNDAPAAVQKALKDAAGDAKIGAVEKCETRAEAKDGKFVKLNAPKISYEAELTKDGKTAEVVVGEDGKVLEQPNWPSKNKEEKKGKKGEEDEENEGGEDEDGD